MNIKKRQILPPGLWVVATPIGNLGDLTERAQQALEEAEVILCEDTRRTSQLLSVLGLSKTLERLDAHATDKQLARVIQALTDGQSFALVTDAGTPAISDPGARIVSLAHGAGIRVTPVPGVSAVMTLLSVAGLEETEFCFRGFFPKKTKEKKEELALAASAKVARIFVWFEAPGRVLDTVEQIALEWPEAQVVAGKELTKLHEKVLVGTASEVAKLLAAELNLEGERGEWCLIVRFAVTTVLGPEESSDWVKALRCLMEEGVSASQSAKRVSQTFGVTKKIVYEMAVSIAGR